MSVMSTMFMKMELLKAKAFLVAANGGLGGGVTDSGSSSADEDYVNSLLNRTGAEDGGYLEPIHDFVKDTGAGVFNISRDAAVLIAGCVALFTGIIFMLYGSNAQKISENKTGAIYKVIGGVVAFAAPVIVVLLMTIGKNLFTGN